MKVENWREMAPVASREPMGVQQQDVMLLGKRHVDNVDNDCS